MILNPNCSEYVMRLELTEKEKEKYKELADKLFGELSYLEDYLNASNGEGNLMFIGDENKEFEIINKIIELRREKEYGELES